MVRHRSSLRGTVAAIAVLATLGLLAFGLRPAYTDDVDLLRFTTAKPYVFFIIDNSASMNLAPDGTWVHGNGDDPRSKMYQVKKAVYEVFKDVNDVQFGFAAFNQDFAQVKAKHWLYYYSSTDSKGGSNNLPNGWPIDYPALDDNGPILTEADGTVKSDIQGDLMTFGAELAVQTIASTCATPLTLGNVGTDDREKVNRIAKREATGAAGDEGTAIWIKANGTKIYQLTVSRPNQKPDFSDNPEFGKNNMDVLLTLKQLKTCAATPVFESQVHTARIELTLFTEFLMNDEDNGRDVDDDTHNGGVDFLAGFWGAQDIESVATCGSGHPFSGKGWEGNYDTDRSKTSATAAYDKHCPNQNNPADPACYNLKRTTVTDPDYGAQKVLDKGDMLPFDWRAEQKVEFLERFAPNHGNGAPIFGIASFFKKDADATTGNLNLNTEGQIPLFASGPSPLGKSVIDFRCWYLGDDNKCKEDSYPTGWETLAGSKDSEWGCRKPYLIVISDGADTCTGENPCADTADLKNKAGVQTWVIAYGADCEKAGNPLKCMAQNGDGQLLCPTNTKGLKDELEKILGLIRQEARSFASAAVPSVQAVVDDKIFLTNFTPLNAEPIWDGHVNAFFKPIPIKNGKPDTTATCPNAEGNFSNCFAWDASTVMLDTQVNATDPVGPDDDQRRVFYARESNEPTSPFRRDVPFDRQLFKATTDDTDDLIRFDLWRGLGVTGPTFDSTDATQVSNAQTAANTVIAETFEVKTAEIEIKNADGTITKKIIEYVLGDVFHSNPLVVGNPPNVQYFALDLNGYQDFAEKHKLRRKMLLVGANDGMLHAFDAGMYNRDKTKFKDKFDMGSGKEIFAYIPRSVLPTVKLLTDPLTTNHQWSVDGTVTVADAFIDPKNGDDFGEPKAAQREWRTLALGGLREGGAFVYALDITQPDKIDDGKPEEPTSTQYVPSCLDAPSVITDGGEDSFCGVLPFPSVLWEFDDSIVTSSGERVFLDEELPSAAFPSGGNNKPDLGETWSVPNVGRIKLAVSTGSATTRDVYVAIFGGGLDPASKTSPQRGTWIYMLDIETGKAIYKRKLEGAMPSEPAAVDTNGDGYLDRIYAGDTAGRVYRIDLSAIDLKDPVDPTDDVYPAIVDEMVWGDDDETHIVERIQKTAWVPRMIFNASFDPATNAATPVDRPIYFRPSVIFDAKLGTYLIAFGTGDRDDLWNNDGQSGRFYVFLDDTDTLSTGLPLNEGVFRPIVVSDLVTLGTNIETLPVGQRGWFLILDTNERVINDPFALAGVTFFSTYKPRVDVTTTKLGPQCSKTGVSRIFIVSTLTANPFVQPPTGVTAPATRQFEVSNFVTNPFTEQRQTKNVTGTTTVKEICDDPTKIAIMESLKTLFPPTCKFGNYMVDIKTIASDTSLVCIAPVPVCLITKNWKEF